MKRLSTSQNGFTIIELLVFIAVLLAVSVLAFSNIRGLKQQQRDNARKTDINAIYYQLEAFHEKNNYYPQVVDVATLKGIDPDSLKDTDGVALGQLGSQYTYAPKDCADAKCKSFSLSVNLEKEAPYTKQSLVQ